MPEPAQPDVPAQFQTFLAFDFGAKRTGVAVGNRMLRTATGQPTIRAEAADARLAQAEQRVREWQPAALVVGVPFHPDGASHDNTSRARKFARQLRFRCGKPCTSGRALQHDGGAVLRRARADAGAACIILEQFLRVADLNGHAKNHAEAQRRQKSKRTSCFFCVF